MQISITGNLPRNKAIVLLSLYSNKHKVPVEMKDLGEEMLRDIEIPVYSFWNFLFGELIVGGSLIDSYDRDMTLPGL